MCDSTYSRYLEYVKQVEESVSLLKMGWAGGDGSSLVPMKTEMLLEPACLGDPRKRDNPPFPNSPCSEVEGPRGLYPAQAHFPH